MVITKSFYLDINTPWKAPTIYIKQGDVDSRKLQATIRRDGMDYSIPNDVTATFRMKKPDGTIVTQDATISGSVVTVILDAQCATAAGHAFGEIVLATAGEVVSTFLLAIDVMAAAVTDGDIESHDALSEYRGLVDEMLRVKGSPLTANTAAAMTDTDRVYVYTGTEVGYVNGSWYYYDGDSWEVGGVYNSQAIADDFLDEVTQMVKQSAVASESDSVPYLYRPTPNPSAILADEEIVGGTIAFNQLADNTLPPSNRDSLTFSGSESGFTVNGTSSAAGNAAGWFGIGTGFWASRQNHKVLYSMVLLSGSITGNVYFVPWDSSAPTPVNMNQQKIATVPNTTGRALFRYDSGTVFTNAKIGVNIMDLTASFGSTIADYVATLESGTAGAGVAKLREWGFLSKDYFAYDAGSLVSVKTEGKMVTGFNLFDKSTVSNGYINDGTGNLTPNANARASDYIDVIPGVSYFIDSDQTTGAWGAWYDADKNFISGIVYYTADRTDALKTKAAPTNAHFMRLTVVYNNNGNLDTFCVSVANPATNHVRVPYRQPITYPTTPTDLNGILKLDASNNLYADGDIYKADGTITRNCTYRDYEAGDESLANAITDGVHTVVKKNSPTTDTADPYAGTQIVGKGGTEQWIDNRSVPVPVGHRTTYSIGVPDVPANASAATLKATVSGGKTTLSWS